MKQMIKFEVKRMLRNPGFYIAMMIGLLISVVHWISLGSSCCKGNG